MTTPTTAPVRLQLRADTAANWTSVNPILLANELGRETDTGKIKIGNGTSTWTSLAYQAWATLPVAVNAGGTGQTSYTNGQLLIGNTTGNTLTKATLTAGSGVAITNGTGSITVAASGIANTNIAADAEIAVSKLQDGTARQLLQTAANGTDVEWASNIDIPGTLDVTGNAVFDANLTVQGDLTVNGTETIINTQTLTVEDKNIELGKVTSPTDVTADGGGITLKGTTDKTINWIDATDAWTLSEHVDLATGKEYRINGAQVLTGTALGSGVTGSSLTSVGTISSGTWQGTTVGTAYGGTGQTTYTNGQLLIGKTDGTLAKATLTAGTGVAVTNADGSITVAVDSTVVTTAQTGTVTSTMIADGTIVDADVNASAAIAGTKISPNFGSQNVVTTGTSTAASLIPTGSSVPTNGVYLPAANSVGISTNGTGRLFVDSSGRLGLGTSSPGANLDIAATNPTVRITSTFDGNPTVGNSLSEINFYGSDTSGAGPGNNCFVRSIHEDTFGSDVGLAFGTTTNNGNGTEKVRINHLGNVGIGTTSPGANLDVAGATFANIFLTDIAAGASGAIYGDGGAVDLRVNNSTDNSFLVTTGSHRFRVSGSEAARIDSSGRLLVGTASAPTPAGDYFCTVGRNGLEGGAIYLSRNVNSNQISSAAFTLGAISVGTNDIIAGKIAVQSDAAGSASSLAGRLVFSVTADGASTPTEALRISNNRAITVSDGGNVVLGTTTGTKIGTATTQKLGFYNATPVVQPTAVADATDAASVITQLNALLTRMRTLGLIAT
jgi:hypothetical protein